MNKALLAKQFWRLTQNENSLLCEWTISKYFKGDLESLSKYTSQPSPAWRSIGANMALIRSHLWWHINSGHQASLNSNFWWKPIVQASASSSTVHSLIDHSAADWDHTQLRNLFSTSIHQQIRMLTFSLFDRRDQLIWKLAVDGLYSVFLGYHQLLTQQEASSFLTISNFSVNWEWRSPPQIPLIPLETVASSNSIYRNSTATSP